MSDVVELTADLLRDVPLPSPEEGSKDARGRVLIVAGSVEIPGAALLAATAALRAGAGKLQVATVRSAAIPLGIAVPEAMVIGLDERDGGLDAETAIPRLLALAGKVDAVSVGAGMVENDATVAVTAALCETTECAFVLDAGALTDLAREAACVRARGGRAVVTPHAGEMAKLLGLSRDEVEADPLEAARRAADLLHAVVVMKGAETHVVDPAGGAWLFRGGNAGLATSGSGDVLAGIVTGLLARGADPIRSALWAVFLHGEAGRRLGEREGPLGYLARELSVELPRVLREFGTASE